MQIFEGNVKIRSNIYICFFYWEELLKGNLKTLQLKNNLKDIKDVCLLLVYYKNQINHVIELCIEQYSALKFNVNIECFYVKLFTDEMEDRFFK